MDTISSYLVEDHARCDALFLQAFVAVVERQWKLAAQVFGEFEQFLTRHLSMEEDVVFRAFEQAADAGSGPTVALRKEHLHLRGIMYRLTVAIEQRRAVDFFDHADTFRIVLQQHSVKEEGILYPMLDRVLHGRRVELIAAMEAIGLADGVALAG